MSASGLSDVLRNLARGEATPPSRPEDVASPPLAKPASAAPPAAPDVRRPPARSPERDPFHVLAVPVLLAVGALLLVPGVWAVAVLMGFDVWRADEPGAAKMALVMLACLPLGLMLFGGAWWFSRPAPKNRRPHPARGRPR